MNNLFFFCVLQLPDIQEAEVQGSVQDGDGNGVEMLSRLLRGRLPPGSSRDPWHSGQRRADTDARVRWWKEGRTRYDGLTKFKKKNKRSEKKLDLMLRSHPDSFFFLIWGESERIQELQDTITGLKKELHDMKTTIDGINQKLYVNIVHPSSAGVTGEVPSPAGCSPVYTRPASTNMSVSPHFLNQTSVCVSVYGCWSVLESRHPSLLKYTDWKR